MKTRILIFLVLAWLLSACTPTTTIPYPIDLVEPNTSIPYPMETVEPVETVIGPTLVTDLPPFTYTDPAGQFRLSLPAGWQPGEEPGLFTGPGSLLQVGYLPEMAFMNSANRVCERLANTPGGPGRKIDLSPLPSADACLLSPYPEMSIDRATLVVSNPGGDPEQRYFYLETRLPDVPGIAASLELLNPPAVQEAFPYPSGPMRVQDKEFWAAAPGQPDELELEEYAVVEASADSPTRFEFLERIPVDVFELRAEWRDKSPDRRLAEENALLEPFGYLLESQPGDEMQLYALYRDGELVQDQISYFWPVSLSVSGQDFALLVELWNGGYHLVLHEQVEVWDMGASLFIPPVFYEDELLHVIWDSARRQVQVMQGEELVFAFAALYLVDMPVKGLWSWDGHWLLEVDGFLVQDGEILNERLGYEEIFGWQLLDGKPFYYFRKGPRVGISYDGNRLPVYYEEIIHYRCCEPAMFNNTGNQDMAWFYGLRDGTWYYVEIGSYEK